MKRFLLIIFAFLLFAWPDVLAQEEELEPEEIEARLESDTLHDTTRLNYLCELALKYQNTYLNKTIKYGLMADSLAASIDKKPDFMVYYAIYRAGRLSHRVIQNFKYLDFLLHKVEKENDPLEKAELYGDIGVIYLNTDRYELGVESENKSIDILIANHVEKEYTKPWYVLARVAELTEEEEEAYKYRQFFLKNADTTKGYEYLLAVFYSQGDYYRLREMYDSANYAYKECLKYAYKMDDRKYIVLTLTRLGYNFYENNQLDSSKYYYLLALQTTDIKNEAKERTNAFGNLANIYRDQEIFDTAQLYYEKALEISDSIHYYYSLKWVYKDYSKMFAEMGDFENAYDNMILHSQYVDSVDIQEYNTQLSRAQARIDALKRQKEMEVLSVRLNKNRIILYGLIGGVVLILLVAFFLIRQNRIKSKQKIADMNHQISRLTQKNLRQQMNPHFVFNTLNSIQYYVFQNDKISANNYMSMFAKLMRKILENSQHTSIPIKDELDAIELYLELERIRFKNKFEWSINVDDEIDTLTYKIPTMIIQPYVENSITHGLRYKNDKGNVWIDMKLEKECITCTIEDNGIGREKAHEYKKLNGDKHNSLGTTITESRLELINTLYGNNMKIRLTDLTDDHGNPAGTRVEIDLPVIT